MKKNLIYKGVAGILAIAAMTPTMTSCKSDYLETAPITNISKSDVSTLDGALYAMQGACSSMYSQRRDGGWNNTCGEPYFNIMYGECLGNAFHDRIWNVYASNLSDWSDLRTDNRMLAAYMWSYAYGLINAANQVLDVVDQIPVTDDNDIAERNFIKAVCLTIRAHSYIKLFQVYGPRWQDSNGGTATAAVVLRTSGEQGPDVPFATSAEVMEQIYKDLDEAIATFGSYDDSYIWTPNVNVAHGLKARAAAIRLDWQTVRSEAQLARAGHPIMSAEQYAKGGFIRANDEYLWATWFQSEGMYYDGHGGTYGCNGWTVHSWGVSSGIDFDLYRNIPVTDCRKGLYLAPGFFQIQQNKERVADALANEWITEPVDDSSFFNPDIVDSSTVRINASPNQNLMEFVNYLACSPSMLPDWNDASMPLTSAFDDGICRPYYGAPYLVAGLQYKFWGVDTFATNQFPYMRASEMAYLEAEAAYALGDEAGARALMVELNKDVRDPNFTCTESGEALLQKIRTYRHIELWGEGFTWFDYKRWNIPMHRSQWKANDPTSGNYQANLAGDFPVDFKQGWRAAVPVSEFNYNKAIDSSDLPNSNN